MTKQRAFITEEKKTGKRKIILAHSDPEARAIAGQSAHRMQEWEVVSSFTASRYLKRESYYQNLYLRQGGK